MPGPKRSQAARGRRMLSGMATDYTGAPLLAVGPSGNNPDRLSCSKPLGDYTGAIGSFVRIADSVTSTRAIAPLTPISHNAHRTVKFRAARTRIMQELWNFTFANVEGDECAPRQGTRARWAGTADRSHAGFRRQVAERDKIGGRGPQNRSASRAISTTSARPTFRLPHHRARRPRRARRRLSHDREADHGEHREARLRHQGCEGAPELGTAPYFDAGGLAVLQEASGAQVWASDASADSLAAGGDDTDAILPLRVCLDWRLRLPASARRPSVQGRRHGWCRADRAHRARHRRAYARLHLVVVPRPRWRPRAECRERVRHGGARHVHLFRTSGRPRAQFRLLRSLPADIWVTAHARWWGRVPEVRREPDREASGGCVHRPSGLPRLHRRRRGGIPKRSHALAAARRLSAIQ